MTKKEMVQKIIGKKVAIETSKGAIFFEKSGMGSHYDIIVSADAILYLSIHTLLIGAKSYGAITIKLTKLLKLMPY